MKTIAIIPARMASSRFPGKPMKPILGMPMIGHVYKRVKMSSSLDEVYVATCDQEIYRYIESIGGKAVMTGDCHERCTERCGEALLKIEKASGETMETVVIVQGDEPLVHPGMIDEAMAPMKNPAVLVVNLVADIPTVEEFLDPNEVKVVCAKDGRALYFSREPIPSMKKFKGAVPMRKQVCIMPFQRDFLLKYNEMAPTPLEIVESVDMMRILENGLDVHMVETRYSSKSVDTEADLAAVEEMMKTDEIARQYL